MNIKLEDKKNILKKLLIFLSVMLFCTVLYNIPKYASKQEIKSENLLANTDDGSNVDINSIELKASLSKLTNVQKLEELKKDTSMQGKTDDEILREAIKQGIIVEQGVLIDIDKLADLKKTMPDKSDEEVKAKAIKKGIIQLGNANQISSINIDSLKQLKDTMQGKTDDEIVRQAINSEIIKGTFSDVDLEINDYLDFNKVDPARFGSSYVNKPLNLSDLKSVPGLKSIKDLGVEGGQVKADYDISLKKNPLKDSAASQTAQDVVLIVDYSTRSTDQQFVNGMDNDVFPKYIKNSPNDTNFMVIPCHKSGIDSLSNLENYYKSIPHNSDPKDWVHQQILKFEGDTGAEPDFSNDMDKSLIMAKEWFKEIQEQKEKTGRKSQASRTIIFLTGQIDDSEYKKCFKDGKFELDETYNASTILLSPTGYGESLSDMSKPYDSNTSNIRKLHDKVGGIDTTFHVSYTEKKGQTSHNDVNDINKSLDNQNLAQKVSIDLGNSRFNRFTNTSGVLNYNLGNDMVINQEELDKDKAKPVDEQIYSVLSNGAGGNIYQIKVPNITLKTDYSILGDNNLTVSLQFVEDFSNNIISNADQSGINNDKVKSYLQDRLKDLNIKIEDDDVKKIIQNVYEERLNITVDDLNAKCGKRISDQIITDKQSYDSIKDKRIIDLLKNNTAYPDDEYGKLKDMLKENLRAGLDERINNGLSEKICANYDKTAEKNEIIDDVLAGTSDGDAKVKIKDVTGKNDTEVSNILDKIKGLFKSDTLVSALNLSDESKEILKNNSLYSKTIKEVLDYKTTDASTQTAINQVNEEIRFLLRQMLNIPLDLTKTTYIVAGNGKTIGFTIEPTVNAALDDTKNQLVFKDNETGSDNNYIEYTSNNNNQTVTKKTLIDSTPILDMKRILVDKNHLVYGKLDTRDTADDRPIFEAIQADKGESSGYDFAKNSMITFASNVMCMTDKKNVTLTIDPKFQPITKDGASGQIPRIYVVNNNQGQPQKQLTFLHEMTEDPNVKGKYVYNNFEGDQYKDIIILYSVKTGDVGTYTNSIAINGISKGEGNVQISVNNNLPDLF